MGCAKSCTRFHLQRELLVATLNYCSIMNSPFQFYCKDLENELHQISNIFASLLPTYIPNFQKNSFKWSMGKLDKFLRTQRYSPLFSSSTGIINGRFMTRKQFEQQWDKKFQHKMTQLQVKYSNQQKENTKLYDFIALHALLIFVFKKQQYLELIKQKPQVYVKTLEPFFQLSFLDEKRKVEKMAEQFLKLDIDIFFIQEFSEAFLHYIQKNKQYIISIDKTKDTMIIAKKTSFVQVRNIETVLPQNHIKKFNISEGTSFLCVDNLILINLHLSSKSDKNAIQIKNLEQALIKINEIRGQFQIIVAGDLNSFFQTTETIRPYFQMFPNRKEQLTTIKKRTMTQAQYHKGDKIVKESKDKIITTLNMKECKISMFNSQQPGVKDFIPSNDHPFDHFLVSAIVFK